LLSNFNEIYQLLSISAEGYDGRKCELLNSRETHNAMMKAYALLNNCDIKSPRRKSSLTLNSSIR
jgi:hypothetical protein